MRRIPRKSPGSWVMNHTTGESEFMNCAQQEANRQRGIEKDAAEKARKDKVMTRVAAILNAHGIKMTTGACGCCGGVHFTMEYRGETFDEEEFNFSNDPKEAGKC